MKGNSSLAIFSTVFAILLFLSEISGHAASAENGVTSPTIGLLRPFDNDFNLTPIFGQALRRARLGDDSSIDIVLRISMNADNMAAEVIGRLVWPVLIGVGDEHFAGRCRTLDSASKEEVFDVLCSEFQPHGSVDSNTLAESNWFYHKFPETYKELVPLKRRIENSINSAVLVTNANGTTGKSDTAYGYPHQDITNYGEAAIPILEEHLSDQHSTSVTLMQNPLSYEGFDANYFVKRIKGTTPTLSVGEFSYFCIAMILKSRPSCYLKQKHSKEINELISQECLDYDGKVSDAGVAAIQKIAEQSQIDDVEDWRLE